MRLHRILFIPIFLLGLALRVVYLITPDLDSDQAIVGLMARHILDGEFPIFYWGENYEGPIESYFASIIFFLFGSSRLTLSLSPFMFSLIFIFLVYRLAREMFNEKVALMAMLIVCASPPYLIWYSVLAKGNYMQNLVFGTLLLLITFRFVNLNCHSEQSEESRFSSHNREGEKILKTRPFASFRVTTPKDVARYYIVIGFTAGLAWWMNFQIVHFLLTTFIFMFLKDKLRFIKRGIIYLFPSFMIGSSLFWYYNLTHHWASIMDIQKYSEELRLSDSLAIFFNYKLPWVLGPFAERGIWYMSKYFILIYGIALLYFIFSYRKEILALFRLFINPVRGLASNRVKRTTGAEILIVFFIIFSVIIIGRYNSGTTLRYYLPIYSVLPIILAASIYNTGRVFRPLPALIAILLAASNMFGDIKGAVVFDSTKLKSYKDSKEREKVFFKSLSDKGIKYVAEIDYWRSFRLTFDSAEEVIFALPTLDWHPNKYPAYTEGLQTHSNPAFMWRGRGFDMILRSQGISFVEENYFNYYFVYHSLKLPEKKGRVIPASTMVASSNFDEIDPKWAIDRDVTSKWSPKISRDDRMYFEIDMKKPYLINKVSILNGGSFDNNPAGFELDVSLDGKRWHKVLSLPALLGGFVLKDGIPVLEGGYLISVFDPVMARYIRMKQGGGEQSMNWNIAEVFIYSPSESELDDDKNPSYSLGLKYYREKKWEASLNEFLKVIKEYPDSERAHYYIWLITKKLGIERLSHLYDNSLFLKRVVDLYEEAGNIEQADFYRKRFIEEFTPAEKRAINFGDVIEFMGYDLKHGRVPEIVYYWKAMKDVKKEWYAFIHFIGSDGKIAFQNDHILTSGGKNSSEWIKGEYYKTQKRFLIDKPEDLRPGIYSIRLGIWDPKTGKSLKVKEGLSSKMDEVIVGELRITE